MKRAIRASGLAEIIEKRIHRWRKSTKIDQELDDERKVICVRDIKKRRLCSLKARSRLMCLQLGRSGQQNIRKVWRFGGGEGSEARRDFIGKRDSFSSLVLAEILIRKELEGYSIFTLGKELCSFLVEIKVYSLGAFLNHDELDINYLFRSPANK